MDYIAAEINGIELIDPRDKARLEAALAALTPKPAEKAKTRGEEVAEEMIVRDGDTNKMRGVTPEERRDNTWMPLHDERYAHHDGTLAYYRNYIARAIDAERAAAKREGAEEARKKIAAFVKSNFPYNPIDDQLILNIPID